MIFSIEMKNSLDDTQSWQVSLRKAFWIKSYSKIKNAQMSKKSKIIDDVTISEWRQKLKFFLSKSKILRTISNPGKFQNVTLCGSKVMAKLIFCDFACMCLTAIPTWLKITIIQDLVVQSSWNFYRKCKTKFG